MIIHEYFTDKNKLMYKNNNMLHRSIKHIGVLSTTTYKASKHVMDYTHYATAICQATCTVGLCACTFMFVASKKVSLHHPLPK